MNVKLYPRLWCLITLIVVASCTSNKNNLYKNWNVYGGTKDALHYSSLTEVDTNNVTELQIAWVYHTGDADTLSHTQIQCNPIIIDSIMFATTPKMKLFAVNVATGKKQWLFDPTVLISTDTNAQAKLPDIFSNTGRGVTYWTNGKEDRRIFYTAGYYLICVNATDGKPVTTFGTNGYIDLHNDLGRDVKNLFITSNTPGIIYKN